MGNPFGPEGPRIQTPQFRLEDLNISKLHRTIRLGAIFVLLLLLWWAMSWGQSFYTDWLWYSEIGQEAVLLKIVSTRVALFLAGAAIFLALAVPNLLAAVRSTGRISSRGGAGLPPNLYWTARKLLNLVAFGAVFLVGLVMATSPAAQWEIVLRYLNQVPFGTADPIFQRDFSFYVFTLPALELLRSWAIGALLAIMAIVAAYYYLSSLLRGEEFAFSGSVRSHLTVLGSLLFVLLAAGHWLGRYELLYSQTGAVYGVGFTDVTVTLPARALLTVVALAAALLLLASVKMQRNSLALGAIGVWFGLSIVALGVLPGLVQRLAVEPSELAREQSFLANNIAATRTAFGLDRLRSASHPALGVIDHQTVAENQGTLRNIRLWDEGPLLQSYNQIQFFRLYYDFLTVHTDRYTVDGELRQVMLASRELSAEKLPSEAQRWVNRYLQFTHGYGVAMSPVTEIQPGGRPDFFIRDLPPTGRIDLERPEVYYGLQSLQYMIVNSRMQEFNYPGPDGPVYTHYQGTGGVPLSSTFRRLMYALQFRDLNILISGEVTPESRIQYRRTIPERFTTLAPFLMRDREAYPWLPTAGSTGSRTPTRPRTGTPTPRPGRTLQLHQKQRQGRGRRLSRHRRTLCLRRADPLIRTYQAMFPGLFKHRDEMPDYLRAHVRYPLDLFTVQTRMLLQYHMRDPVVFYNKEDQWSVPMQTSFGETKILEPYYIVARCPARNGRSSC
jgi:uncharacterized protein